MHASIKGVRPLTLTPWCRVTVLQVNQQQQKAMTSTAFMTSWLILWSDSLEPLHACSMLMRRSHDNTRDHNTTSGQHPHNNINSDVSVCFQLSINLRDPSAAQEAHDVILEARSVLVTDWSIRASGKEEQGRRWSFRFMTELSWKPWRTSDHPTLSNSKNKCTINIF